MTYQESLPAPALQTRVAAYWSIDGAADGTSTLRRVLPDGCADLICDFSETSPGMRWVGTMTLRGTSVAQSIRIFVASSSA